MYQRLAGNVCQCLRRSGGVSACLQGVQGLQVARDNAVGHLAQRCSIYGFMQCGLQVLLHAVHQQETHQRDIDRQRNHAGTHVDAGRHAGACAGDRCRGGIGHRGVGDAQPCAGNQAARQHVKPVAVGELAASEHQHESKTDDE